ncbi:PAS domain-containing protein [Methylobacterium crusticola]
MSAVEQSDHRDEARAAEPDPFSLFRTALEAVGESVVITGAGLAPPGPVIAFVNPAFTRMTGYAAEEVVGKTPRLLQGPLTDRAVLDRLRSDLEARETFQGTAVNYRKDGTPYLLHWHITPLRSPAGELTHWVALQREVAPGARVDEGLEEGVDRVRQITREAAAGLARLVAPPGGGATPRDPGEPGARDLQAQVRRTLATVRSIARRTAETREAAEDYAMHLDGRIDALARLTSAAMQAPGTGVDLGWLVTQELLAFDTPGENRVRISGPKVCLPVRAAEMFGLAVHELTTNALKFGALSEAGGSVTARWRRESRGKPPCIVFRWEESGASTPVRSPEHRGFGMSLLERTLPGDLGATAKLDFAPGGLTYRVALPLPARPGSAGRRDRAG